MKSIYTQLSEIALLLIVGVGLASAQNPDIEVDAGTGQQASNNNAGEQASKVWRCSLDQKFYTVTNSNGLHVRAIGSGQLTADIPLTTDKKGHSKMEGHWTAGASGGLIVIQELGSGAIGGHMLVPANGTAAFACNSRKASIIYSLGQPQPICTVESVRWIFLSNVSSAQAIQEETQELSQASYSSASSAAQPSSLSNSDQQLVGTWFKEVFDGYARYTTTLDLRGNGTYTKALIGSNHSGTWTSSGKIVHLSGNGNYPPTDENLSLFRKTH
jgi:hypothetical protein